MTLKVSCYKKLMVDSKKLFSKMLKLQGSTKNFFTLVSGTTCAQIFSLIFYPIFGRMFSPEDFGLLSNINAIAAIVIVLASGKYEQAVIVTKNRGEAINVLALSISLSIAFCFLFVILCFFFSDLLLSGLGFYQLRGWIYLVPLLAIFIIIYNGFNEWCVKKGAFSSLAMNKIVNSASLSLSKFSLGSLNFGGGLILGEVGGRGFSALSCIYHWLHNDRKDFKLISIKRMKLMAIKYIDFPKYILPDQLINTFTGILPVFFIASYFGQKYLGYYSITLSILGIPMVFVGQATMDVFRNKASADFEMCGTCRRIYKLLLKRLLIVTTVVLLIVIYFLPDLFAIVLGEQWRKSGEFAQILAPSIAFNFLHMTFSSIWIIAGKQKQRCLWQGGFFISNLAAVTIGSFIGDIVIMLYSLSISSMIVHGVGLYCTWLYSKSGH